MRGVRPARRAAGRSRRRGGVADAGQQDRRDLARHFPERTSRALQGAGEDLAGRRAAPQAGQRKDRQGQPAQPLSRRICGGACGLRQFYDPFVLSLRSEEHTSELQSLMRISYAVFCLKKKKNITKNETSNKTN